MSVAVCLVGWALGWVLFGSPRTVTSLIRSGPRAPSVSRPIHVVIPARDEAGTIGPLLASITGSSIPGSRVVVVDDHSTDSTAEVARSFSGVELVEPGDLPDGWTGKNWACAEGVAHLRAALPDPNGDMDSSQNPQPLHEVEGSDILIFLDADVRTAAPELVALSQHQLDVGGLVSVQPWHATERPVEQLSAFFNVIAVMGTAMGSRHDAGRSPVAFGPVLITSHADYDRSGGHHEVRGSVAEDLALARRFAAAGMPVGLFAGGDAVRFRMYPGGLGQLVEGWTKNFATGAGSTTGARLLGVVVWIAALGSALIALVDSTRGSIPLWIGPVLYLAVVAQLWRMFRCVGRFGLVAAALYPVLLVFFLAVFVRSLWLTYVRRRVTWRGRSISVRPDQG